MSFKNLVFMALFGVTGILIPAQVIIGATGTAHLGIVLGGVLLANFMGCLFGLWPVANEVRKE